MVDKNLLNLLNLRNLLNLLNPLNPLNLLNLLKLQNLLNLGVRKEVNVPKMTIVVKLVSANILSG